MARACLLPDPPPFVELICFLIEFVLVVIAVERGFAFERIIFRLVDIGIGLRLEVGINLVYVDSLSSRGGGDDFGFSLYGF